MKILILANPLSSHTIKWVNFLNARGIEIYLFGLNSYNKNSFNKNVTIEILDVPKKLQSNKDGSFSKIIYLTAIGKIKRFIKKIQPDVLHAHYVSSYGLLGALANFHPLIVSVWGTDIYYIPEKNIFYQKLIEFSLSKADKILSTSRAMAVQTEKFTNKKIEVIPFGIDTDKFKPLKAESLFTTEDTVIGTIKTLEKKYGIEYLIRAFKIVKDEFPSKKLKLLIVGSGPEENNLKRIVRELGLENNTVFTGYINPDEIPKYHNMIDIFAALSESESFGVSALEASACEKPIIVSNAEGFKEIVKDELTGFIVDRNNIQQAADKIKNLIKNKNFREKMGRAGREQVLNVYNWNDNVTQMIEVYKQIL